MLFPITPSPTPVLEGAGHLVVNSPPSPILQGADREIWVTYEVEVTHEAAQKYERTPLDIGQLFRTPPSNNPWELYYVAADEFEPKDSGWSKIASTPGIYVLGKRLDGFYEVAVDEPYIPWFLHHNFRFLDKAGFELQFCYDPTQPTKAELEVYGWGGFHVRFLQNAVEAIWSSRSQGLELCLRSIAPSVLQIALEWAILSRDILTSEPLVKRKFTLCLVLLALSLPNDYDTPSVIQLLEKNQEEVLQAFGIDLADLFKTAECKNRKEATHFIGLTRRAFMVAGGLENVHQLKFFDQEYTAIDNLNLLGSLVGVTGSNHFRNFDLQAILSALSRSKAITNEYIDTLDIAELISQLMTLLPIGFQSNLGLPIEAPLQLPLRYELYVPSAIHPLRVLGDGVYELKKAFGHWKLGYGDVMKLRLGGFMTGSTSQELAKDVNMCLPSPLEENRLMTLFVDYDGLYEDHQGTQQRLSSKVLRVIQTMKVGQKVLIIEEEDRNPEEEKEDREKEICLWVVQVLQVLQVRAGHHSFDQKIASDRPILEEKPKWMKRSVRQSIRERLTGPRVECTACGLGRIFSSICCKFLGKSSNRGYVAL